MTWGVYSIPSMQHIEERSMPVLEAGCWLWLFGTDSSGYGSTFVRGKVTSAHRAAWMAYRGNVPDGFQVLHKCDTPRCVNPHHLFLGTVADNQADKVAKNRTHKPAGELHNLAKLRAAQAVEIYLSNERASVLARRYGVSRITVWEIRSGKRWTSITKELSR